MSSAGRAAVGYQMMVDPDWRLPATTCRSMRSQLRGCRTADAASIVPIARGMRPSGGRASASTAVMKMA